MPDSGHDKSASAQHRGAEVFGCINGVREAERHLNREGQYLADIMKIRFYPMVLDRSDGCVLTDLDGNHYLDCIAGASVMNVGYRNARVVAAVKAAMETEWSTTSAIFPHRGQTVLAERLNSLVPGDTKVWFGTSGSEAMDTIGRYFRTASGKPRLVSFVGSFHGQTGGSGALSGMPSHADIPAEHVTKFAFPYPYRCPHGPCSLEGCSLRCMEPLRVFISTRRDEIAGIVVEAIQADGGDVIPPDNFLPALAEMTQGANIWLGVDEVKTGMARTGKFFAFEHTAIAPDAIGIGKALGGGFPISAVIARREILDANIGTCAYTLAGSPVPTAAALAVLDEIEEANLASAANERGDELLRDLREATAYSQIIGDVRGRGLLIGIEVVADKASRIPSRDHAAAIVYRCFELGLIVIYTGVYGNVIELTPPLTISRKETSAAVAIFEEALRDVEAGRFDRSKLARFAGW